MSSSRSTKVRGPCAIDLFLLATDANDGWTDGRAIFSSFRRGAALHHINFKAPVKDIAFSPDGKCV